MIGDYKKSAEQHEQLDVHYQKLLEEREALEKEVKELKLKYETKKAVTF